MLQNLGTPLKWRWRAFDLAVQTAEFRERHLVIAVLPNEQAALNAYRRLQKTGTSPENIAIVGKGYRDADAIGFAKPVNMAKRRAFLTATATGVIGAIFGLTFNLISGIQIFADNQILTWIAAAFFGGISGALGGLLVGGGTGLIFESNESISFRSEIERGKFLILIEGDEALVRSAEQRLYDIPTESLQRYHFRNDKPRPRS